MGPILKLLGVPTLMRKAADAVKQTLIIDHSMDFFVVTSKTIAGSATDKLEFGVECLIESSDGQKQTAMVWPEGDTIRSVTKVSLNRGTLTHVYLLNGDRSMLHVNVEMKHRNGKTARASRCYKRQRCGK
jgi:hypothetical protein